MSKSRTYNTQRVRANRSYTVQEIAELFGIHVNAVHRWVKAGLLCIDDHKPMRIHGSDLIIFLKARQSTRKHACQLHEAYCCKCRKAQAFLGGVVDIIIRNEKQLTLTGICTACSTAMFKGGSVRKMPEYEKHLNVQTVHGRHLVACSNAPVKCEIERRVNT